MINEFENEILWDDDDESFSFDDVRNESLWYLSSNYATSFVGSALSPYFKVSDTKLILVAANFLLDFIAAMFSPQTKEDNQG